MTAMAVNEIDRLRGSCENDDTAKNEVLEATQPSHTPAHT